MTEHTRTEVWLAAAKSGERSALAKLLATCDPRLRARAEARMNAVTKAKRTPDDVLQETYLEVVRQISRFKGRNLASFLSWVCIILDHKLIDAWRAAHCQVRDVDREVSVGGPAADSYWDLFDVIYAESGTPSRVIRREEALGALLTCVSDLGGAQREVVQWRFLEGLSVREVALRVGRSEAAVVALSQRALNVLRSAMDRAGEFTRGA